MNIKTFAFAASSAFILAACASQPAPVEIVEDTATETVDDMASAATGDVNDGSLNAATGRVVAAAPKVGDRVYFDLNGDDLDADDQAVLSVHAQQIAADPSIRILVAGNADERGTREYNLALGERRAETVKTYLVSLGIDAGRIDTVSYGKERPIAGASNEEAWALNRNGFIQVQTGRTS